MKSITFRRIGIFSLLTIIPAFVFAQSNVSPTELVKQMQDLLNQYSERIRILEAENKLYRETLMKNNVHMPLAEYNAVLGSVTTRTESVQSSSNPVVPQNIASNAINMGQNDLQKGFIDQFRKDWPDVRNAYNLPLDSQVGMYEFVVNDKGNNAFVNIFYNGGTPEGAYNVKILYSFDKKTFKRTLVGFFEYDTEKKAYNTKRGKNPFAGTERIRVLENVLPGSPQAMQNTNTSQDSTTNTPAPVAVSADAREVEMKMREAYLAKNYNHVFALSDAFLQKNPGTYLIHFHRYRTFFVQRQFQKTLDEIAIMEKSKLADSRIYCDAYAVATVMKNTQLAQKYKNLAGAGCKLTP